MVAIKELEVVTPNPVRVKVEPRDDGDKALTSKVSYVLRWRSLHASIYTPSPRLQRVQARRTAANLRRYVYPCSRSTHSRAWRVIRSRQTTTPISRSSTFLLPHRSPRARRVRAVQPASRASGQRMIYRPAHRTTTVGAWSLYLRFFATKAVATTLGTATNSPTSASSRRFGTRSTAKPLFTRFRQTTVFTQW